MFIDEPSSLTLLSFISGRGYYLWEKIQSFMYILLRNHSHRNPSSNKILRYARYAIFNIYNIHSRYKASIFERFYISHEILIKSVPKLISMSFPFTLHHLLLFAIHPDRMKWSQKYNLIFCVFFFAIREKTVETEKRQKKQQHSIQNEMRKKMKALAVFIAQKSTI